MVVEKGSGHKKCKLFKKGRNIGVFDEKEYLDLNCPNKMFRSGYPVKEEHNFTERRACRVLGINRTAYRYEPVKRMMKMLFAKRLLSLPAIMGEADIGK